MEVTSVSPRPDSPTEGDDLCEPDVTDVAIHSVTLLICLCELAGNGAVLGLLSLKSRDVVIFDLAFIDFLFLLFAVPSALLILVEDVSCYPVMPSMYMNFLIQLSVVSCSWVLFRLMRSSNVWFVDKLWNLCCCWDLPLRLLWAVDTVQYWTFLALFTVIPAVTFLCPSHHQEHCRAALISMYIIILLRFVASLLISSRVDFLNAKSGSQQKQPQRHDVIVLIVLFTLLLTICNFLQQLGYIVVSSQVVFLITCIHSSIKPFIYFLVGRCCRPCSVQSLQLSLQRVFEEPKENTAKGDDPAMDTGV